MAPSGILPVMWFSAAALLLGLVTVLLAVYRDAALDAPRPAVPEWDLLPMPADVARIDFPLAIPGYDPASVETHLEVLRRAYEDVVAVAPPEVLARARRRAAERAGITLADDPAAEPGDGRPAWAPPVADQDPPESWPASDGDALRLEAALSQVDPPPDQQRPDTEPGR